MGFRFSLASVLRVKESIEKGEEVALQRSQLAVASAQRTIEKLAKEIASANELREGQLRDAVSANRLQMMQMEISGAMELKDALNADLQNRKLERDAQMKRYRAAHGVVEMFTDLKKQQKTLYEQEQLRLQQKRLDDIVVARRQRN